MFRLLLGFWIMGDSERHFKCVFFSTGGLIINNIFLGRYFFRYGLHAVYGLFLNKKQIGKGLLWFIVPLLISALPLVVFLVLQTY